VRDESGARAGGRVQDQSAVPPASVGDRLAGPGDGSMDPSAYMMYSVCIIVKGERDHSILDDWNSLIDIFRASCTLH
jgi:hypothetical protein